MIKSILNLLWFGVGISTTTIGCAIGLIGLKLVLIGIRWSYGI